MRPDLTAHRQPQPVFSPRPLRLGSADFDEFAFLRAYGGLYGEHTLLSFGIVAHVISVLPLSLLGGVLAWEEGISISKVESASEQTG